MRGGLVIVLLGCGRVAFDPRADSAAVGDTSDASSYVPFGTPTPVSFNGATEDDDPALGPGLLELVFDSYRAGFQDNLWVVTRSSVTSPWSAPAPITELTTSSDDDAPFITDDGKTLYFSSTRAGGLGGDDIWMAIRSTPQDAWSIPSVVPGISGPANDFGLTTSADQLYGMFTSNRDGTLDLFEVSRLLPSDPWSMPLRIDVLSEPGAEDEEPMLSPDGLTLAFGSNRAGSYDLYLATRATRTAPWSAPVPIAELNTPDEDENDPWLTADGSQIWFTIGLADDRDIYTASR